jgi:trehalose utilization protein
MRQSKWNQPAMSAIRITIWNEFIHEKSSPAVRDVYPDGIHTVLATALGEQLGDQATIRTATLNEPEHGLSEQALAETDVLLWWGHAGHELVADEVIDRVQQRVLNGMGFIPLHSAHMSKIFRRLMGTTCTLRWREAGERERVWCVHPAHPIAAGFSEEFFEIERSEMYGEHFDISAPDELVFVSWFEGGEVFRSGCTFYRGAGRIFYFSPGHETYPIYRHEQVQRVLANAVRWAAPQPSAYSGQGRNIPEALSPIARPAASNADLHR